LPATAWQAGSGEFALKARAGKIEPAMLSVSYRRENRALQADEKSGRRAGNDSTSIQRRPLPSFVDRAGAALCRHPNFASLFPRERDFLFLRDVEQIIDDGFE
jgi:hypothetical protein